MTDPDQCYAITNAAAATRITTSVTPTDYKDVRHDDDVGFPFIRRRTAEKKEEEHYSDMKVTTRFIIITPNK